MTQQTKRLPLSASHFYFSLLIHFALPAIGCSTGQLMRILSLDQLTKNQNMGLFPSAKYDAHLSIHLISLQIIKSDNSFVFK